MTLSRTAAALMTLGALGALGACSSRAPAISATSYVGIFDRSSLDTSALTTAQVGDSRVTTWTGELDRASNTITLNGYTGTLSADRTKITFASGTGTITAGTTQYVAQFTASPDGLTTYRGVLGIPTAPTEVPTTGEVNYSGTGSSSFTILDSMSDTRYEVTGDVAVTVNFQTGAVTMTFDALNGTQYIGSDTGGVPANSVGTIEIDNAEMADGTFSGGTASYIPGGQSTSTLSGDETVTTEGGVYGPGASEIGGVVIIDDTGTTGSGVDIEGNFVAK